MIKQTSSLPSSTPFASVDAVIGVACIVRGRLLTPIPHVNMYPDSPADAGHHYRTRDITGGL